MEVLRSSSRGDVQIHQSRFAEEILKEYANVLSNMPPSGAMLNAPPPKATPECRRHLKSHRMAPTLLTSTQPCLSALSAPMSPILPPTLPVLIPPPLLTST
ncbi:unnamed protein product [Ceratitis capitata]|uniref:(Mediterranean fruit fly) hypothetical protein n=1 Tax=Ceratitis capitata TaxID=7213 RepID=A0A811UPN6_CERCA|nr:unnamed protein product [Ceratitis capitata]